MSDNIVHARPLGASAAEKLIRKYPTVYGTGLSEETITDISEGKLKAEVVTYEDGNRGLRVSETSTPTPTPKPKPKKKESPVAAAEEVVEAVEVETTEPVAEDSAEEL